MVDSIDFSTLDLTSEFAEEEAESQLGSSHHGSYHDDTQLSTEAETFDNYELSFLSQRSQTPSQLSGHSSQSQHNTCTNCGSYNTFQVEDTGHKICTKCSHIVEDYENLQSAEHFGDEDDDQIAEQQQDILKEHHKSQYQALNKEIIHCQEQYAKLILNAFQCVLQSQVSVAIHEYNVKPHLYNIVAQIWFRFINKIWIKQGFGHPDEPQNSSWVWNKRSSKLYQNNDFKEQWTAPKMSVIDVLMTTEDDTDTSSDEDMMENNHNTNESHQESHQDTNDDDEDSIDLRSLLSDASTVSHESRASETSITQSKAIKQKKRRKTLLTDKQIRKRKKRINLKRKQTLPIKRTRFTARIPTHDVFGWKRVQQRYEERNARSKFDEYLYGKGEIDLELSLVLLYIGLRVCGETLTMNDVIRGAQKGIIPYLRAFESLPSAFRIKDSKQRRRLYGSDDNYLSFRKFFIRHEMKYEIARFYHIYHLLIGDLGLIDKIIPFNSKLMVIKYLRDLRIPLALYSIVEVFIDKYKRFPKIFGARNTDMKNEWKELAEYKSIFVDYSKRKKSDLNMKMIFTNGIDDDRDAVMDDEDCDTKYKHLTPVTIMTLIVIAIASVYRLDKTIKHKLNEHPLLNNARSAFKTLPALSQWFDVKLKYKYMDCKVLCDVPKMFGYDTLKTRKEGGLQHENTEWIFGLTKQFILRHYGVRSHCTVAHKFIERKAKKITKKYTNLHKEYKEKSKAELNGYKAFNSLSICGNDEEESKDKCDTCPPFEYHGYDAQQTHYSLLYSEVMLLCSARVGIKLKDLHQRLQQTISKLMVVFEYEEVKKTSENDVAFVSIPVNRLVTKTCTHCDRRYRINELVQCYCNESCDANVACDTRICKVCLLKLVHDDAQIVKQLLMKQRCGILKAHHWKCFMCQAKDKHTHSEQQMEQKKKRKEKNKSKNKFIRKTDKKKAFECSYCHRGFSRKYNMNVHIAMVHDHSLLRFECDTCSLKCATAAALRRHQINCNVK
eukprot:392860_1